MPGRLHSVIIGLIVFVAGCGAPVSAADKIKIGYIATMSGPAASLGQDILDGFKLGMTHVGNTLGGRPVDLIVGDDQLKPDVGVQVASEMVEKGQGGFYHRGRLFKRHDGDCPACDRGRGVSHQCQCRTVAARRGGLVLQNLFTVSWQK